MAGDEAKLDIKLKWAAQRTAKILDPGKRETIEWHLKALKSTINETDGYKRLVEAKKIEKDDLEEISQWNTEIEAKISEAEDEADRIQQRLNGKRLEEENYAREEQLKFGVKLEETKLQVKAKIQDPKPRGQSCRKLRLAKELKVCQ